MQGGAAAVALLVFVLVVGAAGAYFYYFTLPKGVSEMPVQQQQQQSQQQQGQQEQAAKAAYAVDVDQAGDAVYVSNYGTITNMAVFVDGEQVQAQSGTSDDRKLVFTLANPLQTGDHTVTVKAGSQSVEKRVTIEERWTVSFDVKAS